MKFLSAFLFMAFVSATSSQVNPPIITQARSDNALYNYLMQSSASLTNPTLAGECFAKHLPLLSKIAQTFSVKYQECLTLANNRTDNLAMQAMQSRDAFVLDITVMCSAFQSCDHEREVLEFFHCYANVCSQDMDLIYNISNKVSFAASSYRQNLQLIQEDSAKCTNASEHAYIKDTAATYKLLDNCLQHGLGEDENTSTITTACDATDATEATTTETTEDKDKVDEDLRLKFIIQAMVPGRTVN